MRIQFGGILLLDYETKLAEEREYGEEKGILSATVNAIKKIIRRNRSYGVSDSKTLEDLTEDYMILFPEIKLNK